MYIARQRWRPATAELHCCGTSKPNIKHFTAWADVLGQDPVNTKPWWKCKQWSKVLSRQQIAPQYWSHQSKNALTRLQVAGLIWKRTYSSSEIQFLDGFSLTEWIASNFYWYRHFYTSRSQANIVLLLHNNLLLLISYFADLKYYCITDVSVWIFCGWINHTTCLLILVAS